MGGVISVLRIFSKRYYCVALVCCLFSSCIMKAVIILSLVAVAAALPGHPYLASKPRADDRPNDIYSVPSRPSLPRRMRILYPNIGALKDFIKDPEGPDYIIRPRDIRPEVNEVRTPGKISNLRPAVRPSGPRSQSSFRRPLSSRRSSRG